MQSIKSLPSRKFQDWEAAEMRWDWNPNHRLNCFGRAHSCCCWRRRVKSCLLTFHFLLTLFLSCLEPVPISNGFSSVSQVLSVLFIVTSVLKAVSKIWYVLNICLINDELSHQSRAQIGNDSFMVHKRDAPSHFQLRFLLTLSLKYRKVKKGETVWKAV